MGIGWDVYVYVCRVRDGMCEGDVYVDVYVCRVRDGQGVSV